MERTLDYKGRWRNHTVAFRYRTRKTESALRIGGTVGIDEAGLHHKAAAVPGRGGTG
mgnify:CR=1 FL=1